MSGIYQTCNSINIWKVRGNLGGILYQASIITARLVIKPKEDNSRRLTTAEILWVLVFCPGYFFLLLIIIFPVIIRLEISLFSGAYIILFINRIIKQRIQYYIKIHKIQYSFTLHFVNNYWLGVFPTFK